MKDKPLQALCYGAGLKISVQEKKMKLINGRKAFASCAAAIALAVLAGCASGPRVQQKTDLLDDKGAALGIPTPTWVTAYVSGGNEAVGALPEYKDSYAFVINNEGTDKPFLLSWVGSVDGPREVAAFIATTVETNAQSALAGAEGEGITRVLTINTETMSNASYTGLRKIADWWLLGRNKATKVERYQAFVLYTGEKQSLNDQIVRNLQNIVDNNAAMSNEERKIYADIMDDIRRNGLFG
jgi:uncharacterized lipoprotein YmbA